MKKLALFIITIMFTAYQGKAQLAIVNSQKVLASVSAIAKTDTLIAKETAGYAAEYNKKQLNLNQLVKIADSLYKLDSKSTTTNKAIADAQTADKDMKAYAETSNKKLAEYKQLLQKPYIDKVMEAIKAVALRLKYMQVIDSSSVGVLYLNPLSDITEQVIKELKTK